MKASCSDGWTSNRTPLPPTAAAPSPKMASSLGADLIFEGSIHGDGELLIDGAIKGDVHVAHLGDRQAVQGTR